ncbi:MAG: amidohydrolase family protein [Chitinophagaceae bacterium]|nr:amidohydrolase family protein [Chitinophagaceae bacterium]MBL0307570.1 amidohydrolase family protein [Chitinophagaceae bacterium]HQV61473.1 amidohydrolase family protein [Chitinophagaceae bacterium]HQV85891.1 amidohydrolase family protein [Chitinophagaceae bacterium]HQX74011.1 amidohydrolase family protein [Chitinophagaceae bacterium]
MLYIFLKARFLILAATVCICLNATAQSTIEYDIVLSGGRVIDPETKLDAIRNVGINNNLIAQISTETLKGKQTINVSGLVVAPGFIDMHIHGRSNVEQEYQLHDGVTTALELEWGIEHLGKWYASRKGKALINYGASVNWPFERFKAIGKYQNAVDSLLQITLRGEANIGAMTNTILRAATETITPDALNQTLANIKASLAEGGIGIGAPIGYLPKTNPNEMFQVYKLAGELQALVFSHVRQPDIISIQEAIADAVLTGAPLHIVHINSMSLGNIGLSLEMVNAANKKGFDISTELYPYTAGSTSLQSAMFDEGWQQRLGISYGDLQWVATGERLTKETFDAYRKTGGVVILHVMKPEWIQTGIAAPGVMIGSDGMTYAKLAHPRTAGTFSRVLGKYVREEKVLDLNTAIEKMTLLPAKRLENIAPSMRFKGRIQVGADADITIFNPETIIDKATFEKGLEFSAGIEYVLVNGSFVLKNGKTVSNVFPGQAVYGKFKK